MRIPFTKMQGAGNDFVSYRFDDFAGPVTVDFRSVTSGVNTISDQRGGTDTVSNFERIGISGSNSDDVLRGSTAYADYIDAQAQLHAWVEQGAIRVFEDIIEGFDNLPAALIGLLHGENRGKRMVKIS